MVNQTKMPSAEAKAEAYHKRLDLTWDGADALVSDSICPFPSIEEAYRVFYGLGHEGIVVSAAQELCGVAHYELVGERPRTPAESAQLAEMGTVHGAPFAVAVYDSMNRHIRARYKADLESDWRSLVSQHRNGPRSRVGFSKIIIREETSSRGTQRIISSIPRNVDLQGKDIVTRATVHQADMASHGLDAIHRLPSAMAADYKRQQWNIVFSEITSTADLMEETSPNSKARYSSEAGNLSNHALNAHSLQAAIQLMQQHKLDDLSHSRPTPKFLFVAPEDESIAHALCSGGNVFNEGYKLQYRVMDSLATSNTWYLMAQPNRGLNDDTIGCITYPNEIPMMSARGQGATVQLGIAGSTCAAMLDHRMFHKAEYSAQDSR